MASANESQAHMLHVADQHKPEAATTVPCRVCATTRPGAVVVTVGGIAVSRCSECDVESCADVLSDEQLAAAYDGFTGVGVESSNASFSEYVRQSRESLRFDLRLRPGGAQTTGLRFLDYGCGRGHFVQAAADLGMRAVGMELDGQSVASAREHGLDVVQGTLPSAAGELPVSQFDFIKCMHVLEHLRYPREVLTSFKKMLAPGGLIAIQVPDQSSFPSRLKIELRRFGIRKADWGFIQPPIHLHGYAPKTFRVAARSVGLRVVEVRKTSPLDPIAFPSSEGYWASMRVQKVIYRLGRLVRSGGHLTCYLAHAE